MLCLDSIFVKLSVLLVVSSPSSAEAKCKEGNECNCWFCGKFVKGEVRVFEDSIFIMEVSCGDIDETKK